MENMFLGDNQWHLKRTCPRCWGDGKEPQTASHGARKVCYQCLGHRMVAWNGQPLIARESTVTRLA